MYRNTQRDRCVPFQASILSFNCVCPYTPLKSFILIVSQVTFRLLGKNKYQWCLLYLEKDATQVSFCIAISDQLTVRRLT